MANPCDGRIQSRISSNDIGELFGEWSVTKIFSLQAIIITLYNIIEVHLIIIDCTIIFMFDSM